VSGFGNEDVLEFNETGLSGTLAALDTNRDGRLAAGDSTVRVKDDSMTVDLTVVSRSRLSTLPLGTDTLTLVGRTSPGLDRILVIP
jgi:hypothetical protein